MKRETILLLVTFLLAPAGCASRPQPTFDEGEAEAVRQHAEDAFAGRSSGREAPAHPVPSDPQGTAAAPKETSGGKPPAWVEGNDPNYPQARYLTGVGIGSTRAQAEEQAYTAISRIFSAKIESTHLDQQRFFDRFGEDGKRLTQEAQSVEEITRVTTDKLLSGVQIGAVWHDEKEGRYYALALLDRQTAARSLLDHLSRLDASIETLVTQGEESPSLFGRFAAYAEALDKFHLRTSLNAELRLIDPTGAGLRPPVEIETLVSRFLETRDQLKIGITVEGNESDEVGMCLLDALTDKGMKVSLVSPEQMRRLHVLIRCSTEFARAGEIHGSQMVDARLNVQLLDVQRNQVVRNIRKKRKVGRNTLERSISLGVAKLCNEVVPEVVNELTRFSTDS